MRSRKVWRDSGFLKLWLAQLVSLFGSQITLLALPLTAALVLDASAQQMGLLTAAGALPALLLGLPTGVYVDRSRRRPILIAADLGRAAVLSLVPLAAVTGFLRMELLVGVAFLAGALRIFFDVAHRSYLPALVGRQHLVEGNSRLELSRSVAEIAGPGLAGALVQLVTAPFAILVDAASFLLSAFLLLRIRSSEPQPPPVASQVGGLADQIRVGLRLVATSSPLRAIAGCLASINLFNGLLEAVFVLYVTRVLGIGAGLLGLVFAAGSVGFLAGALIMDKVTVRLGLGATVTIGVAVAGVGDLLIPLLHGGMSMTLLVGLLMLAQALFGIGLVVFSAGQVSIRQGATPDDLQGRMNATMVFIAGAAVPAGALLGGWLGEAVGLRTALLIAAVGEILSVAWLLFSPVRSLREPGAASETRLAR